LIKSIALNQSIAVHTDKEYRLAIQEIFRALKLVEKANAVERVVIKPNLVVCNPYQEGSVTDPLVIEVLLGLLKESFDGEIFIAEAEAVFKTKNYMEKRILGKTKQEYKEGFQLSLRNSGILSVLQKYKDQKIFVLDVSDAAYEEPEVVKRLVQAKYGQVAEIIHSEYFRMVPKILLEGKILGVNLAKFKTHDNRPTIVTLALKNLYGFTTPPDREHLHGHWHNPWRLADSVIAMNLIYLSLFHSWVHVVDGLRFCMEGNGPTRGTTVRDWGKIAAGTNPVELDAICAYMMGQRPEDLPYLNKALKFLGSYDREVLAQIPPEFVRKFELNDKVKAWIKAENAHNPYILYLNLTGRIWNKVPKLARLLSPLVKFFRRILRLPKPERKL
jgi:uncharacterized protein (DUF362 family)